MRSVASVGIAVCLAAACTPPGDGPPGAAGTGGSSDAARYCPKGSTLSGIDVSVYQGYVSWRTARRSGVVFGLTRVADGATQVDPTFLRNWVGMQQEGVIRGAYQYLRPAQDPRAQADLFVKTVKSAGWMTAGDLPPVLDINLRDGVDIATVVAVAQIWLDRVTQGTGRKPMLYAPSTFLALLTDTGLLAKYPIWAADYGVDCPTLPNAVGARWTIWQRVTEDSAPGVGGPVAIDVFNGTIADMDAFTGAGQDCTQDADCTDSALGTGRVCSALKRACVFGCHAASDCTAGSICDTSTPDGTCQSVTCQTDADCTGGKDRQGLVCHTDTNACVPGCKSDLDCPLDVTCDTSTDDGACQLQPCIKDSDCNGGQAAMGYVCSTTEAVCVTGCHANSDCPGATCNADTQNGTCTPKACQSDSQCNAGVHGTHVVCSTGAQICAFGCHVNSDCAIGFTCAPGLGTDGQCQ